MCGYYPSSPDLSFFFSLVKISKLSDRSDIFAHHPTMLSYHCNSLSHTLFSGHCLALWNLSDASYLHSHTLTITCTCCYDKIKGTQYLKTYSPADSLILSWALYPHAVSYTVSLIISLIVCLSDTFFACCLLDGLSDLVSDLCVSAGLQLQHPDAAAPTDTAAQNAKRDIRFESEYIRFFR